MTHPGNSATETLGDGCNEVRVPKSGEAMCTYYEALGWSGGGAGYAGVQVHPRAHNFISSIGDLVEGKRSYNYRTNFNGGSARDATGRFRVYNEDFFANKVLWGSGPMAKDSPAKEIDVDLIVCDDLNDYVTGMGGHPQAKTPNIEKLAQSGVMFRHAYSNSPICAPSRSSFLTGIYPHTSKNLF